MAGSGGHVLLIDEVDSLDFGRRRLLLIYYYIVFGNLIVVSGGQP